MVTAAALAHVSRLPVLFLPGDVFASRRLDPVLQQIEGDFGDGTISANDSFRPVSRYFDRLVRPESCSMPCRRPARPCRCCATCAARSRWLSAGGCAGQAFDYQERFFQRHVWRIPSARADRAEIASLGRNPAEIGCATNRCRRRRRLRGRGGGAWPISRKSMAFRGAVTCQAGQRHIGVGCTRWRWALSASPASLVANAAAENADRPGRSALDCRISPRVRGHCSRAEARAGQRRRVRRPQARGGRGSGRRRRSTGANSMPGWPTGPRRRLGPAPRRPSSTAGMRHGARRPRRRQAATARFHPTRKLSERCGAHSDEHAVVVGLTGGPARGAPHKLVAEPRSPAVTTLEYGYSCMGYEIAGGLGVKLAEPQRDVYCDGRRRQLPDVEFEAGDLGLAWSEARRRAARQPPDSGALTGCSRRPGARRSTIFLADASFKSTLPPMQRASGSLRWRKWPG